MRLLKLEITGFKSFHNRTILNFPEGITAVVGPNGCGKSNIVDALRWVMGEQSAKQLRGKSMEDLIFSGSDGRQPLNMAEVTLLVDNSSTETDISPMTAYTEIMVTRRLYRSGESVYMINRQPCRLKDIHNLFLGSGTGKNSFAVIQQGNIGALTDASPEERRYFIEDAADITKYKERKKETLVRIKTTRENLVRITDILSELKKRINTLERQAEKAKKYRSYREKIKTLEISIALWNYESLGRSISEKKAASDRAAQSEADINDAISFLEVFIDNTRQQIADRRHALSDLTEKTFGLQRSSDRKTSDFEHAKKEIKRLVKEIREGREKKKEVSEKNSSLVFEVKESQLAHDDTKIIIVEKEKTLKEKEQLINNRKERQLEWEEQKKTISKAMMILAGEEAKTTGMLAHDEQKKNDLKRRFILLGEEHLTAEKKLIETEEEKKIIECESEKNRKDHKKLLEKSKRTSETLKEAREESEKIKVALRDLDVELSGCLSKYRTLKEMDENFNWYGNGVQSLMTWLRENRDNRVKGIVGDRIKPSENYEKALEAALGEELQYMISDSTGEVEELINELKTHNMGQCGFIPLNSVSRLKNHIVPEGLSLLSDHVSCAEEDIDLVRYILGGTLLSEDLKTAVELRKKHNLQQPVVTINGEKITEKGFITGGFQQEDTSVFIRKNELSETSEEISSLENRKKELLSLADSAENVVRQLSVEESRQKELLSEIEAEKNRIDKNLYIITAALHQAEQKIKITDLEQERLEGDEEDMDTSIAQKKSALALIRKSLHEKEEQIAALGNEADESAWALEKEVSDITALRTDLARLKAERNSYENSVRRLEDFLKESNSRLDRLNREETEKKNTARDFAKKRKLLKSELEASAVELEKLSEKTTLQREELILIENNLKQKEIELDTLEKQREQERESIRAINLELTQLTIKRENITARIEEKYHHQINQYKLEFAENEFDRIDVSTLNIPFLEAELEDLTSRIAKLGEVNLSSISEYEEVKQRYDFMVSQEKDLVKSLEDLETIIDRINSISKERFYETFKSINEKLAILFTTLFEGGSAKMELTEPANPLESGVELLIQPPGKKLTRLSLLSGGEKALSAIAFVFSIFLIKPASFCVMDEIDAPLDDANVTRFNSMVRYIGEQSQILMITHNKVTMEFADTLFGVTMEKKGVSKIVSVNLTETEGL